MASRAAARRSTSTLVLALVTVLAAACGDGATAPEEPDINPDLLEGGDVMGLASAGLELPQGSATFTGPAGVLVDATGEEFIQQLTLDDGTVLKTSGIAVRAVPDESVADAPFDRVAFGSALTGSHASVPPGSYAISGDWPEIDFVDEVAVTYAQVRPGEGQEYVRGDGGAFTIVSVEYFDDVYPCEPTGDAIIYDLCEYQLGVLEGIVEFTAELASGALVQDEASFTLPIRRRTIFARLNR